MSMKKSHLNCTILYFTYFVGQNGAGKSVTSFTPILSVHGAKLLIMDEATTVLDPVVRNEILDIFLE